MIKFDAKTQIIVSDNLVSDIIPIVEAEQSKNIAVIVDRSVAKHDSVKDLCNSFTQRGALFQYEVEAIEPTVDLVNEYVSYLRNKNIDLIVGIGGGSIIDLSKALSVMIVNDGRVEDYHGTGKVFSQGVKKIMVPTTAGTGSEVTPGAVLLNPKTKFKRALASKYVAPDYAVLYPYLTMGMPDNITATTGMDALGHAIESYTAKCANEITRMYSKEAFRLVYNALPKVFENKNNLDLRRQVLLGACLAGYAIYNSCTGACHGISYALGIYNNIPHGLAVARLLPKVVALNVKKGCTIYSDLYDLIEGQEKCASVQEKAERFSALLKDYKPLEKVTKKFKDYKVNKDTLNLLAERGLDLALVVNNNPVFFGLDDSKSVLARCISEDEEYV